MKQRRDMSFRSRNVSGRVRARGQQQPPTQAWQTQQNVEPHSSFDPIGIQHPVSTALSTTATITHVAQPVQSSSPVGPNARPVHHVLPTIRPTSLTPEDTYFFATPELCEQDNSIISSSTSTRSNLRYFTSASSGTSNSLDVYYTPLNSPCYSGQQSEHIPGVSPEQLYEKLESLKEQSNFLTDDKRLSLHHGLDVLEKKRERRPNVTSKINISDPAFDDDDDSFLVNPINAKTMRHVEQEELHSPQNEATTKLQIGGSTNTVVDEGTVVRSENLVGSQQAHYDPFLENMDLTEQNWTLVDQVAEQYFQTKDTNQDSQTVQETESIQAASESEETRGKQNFNTQNVNTRPSSRGGRRMGMRSSRTFPDSRVGGRQGGTRNEPVAGPSGAIRTTVPHTRGLQNQRTNLFPVSGPYGPISREKASDIRYQSGFYWADFPQEVIMYRRSIEPLHFAREPLPDRLPDKFSWGHDPRRIALRFNFANNEMIIKNRFQMRAYLIRREMCRQSWTLDDLMEFIKRAREEFDAIRNLHDQLYFWFGPYIRFKEFCRLPKKEKKGPEPACFPAYNIRTNYIERPSSPESIHYFERLGRFARWCICYGDFLLFIITMAHLLRSVLIAQHAPGQTE